MCVCVLAMQNSSVNHMTIDFNPGTTSVDIQEGPQGGKNTMYWKMHHVDLDYSYVLYAYGQIA